MTKTKKAAQNEAISSAHEQQLATDLEIISLLRENPDILDRRPELLSELELSHNSGGAVSLIERQVMVLRQQLQQQDDRLRELMTIARDNERLANSRHRLAINLFAARDLDEVVSIVLDVLSNELAADHAVMKLFTGDENRIAESTDLFISSEDSSLTVFKTMLEHKNTVCGKATVEQKHFLFGDAAEAIRSVAIIPLVSGANLGLIGLGANNFQRFKSTMGTEFLSQLGELISASLAVHMEG